MIGYATFGTNDIDRARTFYDALLGEIGGRRVMEFPQNGFTMYGTASAGRASPSPGPMTAAPPAPATATWRRW